MHWTCKLHTFRIPKQVFVLAVDLVSERLAVNFGLFISNDLVIQYIYLQAP